MGGWLRRLKAVGSVLLSGSATPLRPAAPDTILYGGSYLRWWNGGEERVQSTADPKNARFRHMSGASQTRRVCTYTHTHKDKNNTNGKDSRRRYLSLRAPEHLGHSITPLTQSKVHLIKIGSVQFCSNRINQRWKLSSWLTAQRDACDCCSFPLTEVCTCAHSRTLTHRHAHTQLLFLQAVNVSADISLELVL